MGEGSGVSLGGRKDAGSRKYEGVRSDKVKRSHPTVRLILLFLILGLSLVLN